MQGWEYVRIMNQNYLQVPCRRQQEESFQYRMLSEETIPGLLKCKLRIWNGASYLLYDISSMQNFSSLWRDKKMEITDISNLLLSQKRTVKGMEAYLLEAENLLFCPELVFQEPDTKEIRFLYYPCLGEEQKESNASFWNFLLSVVNHEDEKLTELVYYFYEKAESLQTVLWIEEFSRKLEELGEEHKEAEPYRDWPTEENEKEILVEDAAWEKTDKEILKQEDNGKKRSLQFGGLSILLIIIFLYYVHQNYILSYVEKITLAGGILTASITAGIWIYHRCRRTGENFMPGTQEDKDIAQKSVKESVPEFDSYGKTVYFEAEETENKLYGMGKENRQVIEMRKFPFTIGKKEDVVDAVITAESVSRIHARFFEEEGTLYLEDLNSTNGTYKNGILLIPHEKAEVFQEDEIRFGRLSFLYR